MGLSEARAVSTGVLSDWVAGNGSPPMVPKETPEMLSGDFEERNWQHQEVWRSGRNAAERTSEMGDDKGRASSQRSTLPKGISGPLAAIPIPAPPVMLWAMGPSCCIFSRSPRPQVDLLMTPLSPTVCESGPRLASGV